jgi:glucose/arabinose dehydrogenase
MLNMAKSLAAAVFTLALSAPLAAATLPNGFSETLVTGGLSAPTAMAFTPDGRLFVCQQGGQLRVIENGTLLPTPFVSLTVNSSGERGLLGVAIDPNFTSNQFVYVYYTATTPAIHNRISRFTANGNVAAGGSEVVLLDLDNLSGATNHNGGGIHFALDGTLIAGVGENATTSNAQTLNNLLGKMLRINADGTIPADNPFFNQASGKNRAIWALGLRNPYTFAIQPGTGRMFINDVGGSQFEEINDGIAGSNYGWPISEGPTSNPDHRGPVYHYGHGSGPFLGCAITGGTFYNPAASQFPPAFVGDYFFADLCGGWINRRDADTGSVTTFASGISQPVDLQVGPDGSLYYLARGSGSVFRVSFPGFTDTLTAGVTVIRAVHVTELRDRIGALRARFQLSPFNWTDPSLGTGTMALAIHIVDLRTAIADAYLAAGQDAPEYTEPTLQPQSTVIKAAHIIELRSAILTLEAS